MEKVFRDYFDDCGDSFKFYIESYTIYHTTSVPFYYDKTEIDVIIDDSNTEVGLYKYNIFNNKCVLISKNVYKSYISYRLELDGSFIEPHGPKEEDVLSLFNEIKEV